MIHIFLIKNKTPKHSPIIFKFLNQTPIIYLNIVSLKNCYGWVCSLLKNIYLVC